MGLALSGFPITPATSHLLCLNFAREEKCFPRGGTFLRIRTTGARATSKIPCNLDDVPEWVPCYRYAMCAERCKGYTYVVIFSRDSFLLICITDILKSLAQHILPWLLSTESYHYDCFFFFKHHISMK